MTTPTWDEISSELALPRLISEATRLQDEGNYEQALEMLSYVARNLPGGGFEGVLLPALCSTWADLLTAYPPSSEPLLRLRDGAEALFFDTGSAFAFRRASAISEALHDPLRIVRNFFAAKEFGKGHVWAAYDLAEPSLVQCQEFDAMRPYFNPTLRFQQAVTRYGALRRARKQSGSSPLVGRLARSPTGFLHDICRLCATLFHLGRQAEAGRYRDEAIGALEELADQPLTEPEWMVRNYHPPTPAAILHASSRGRLPFETILESGQWRYALTSNSE